jgi:nitrite reductase/ring-hydroxylating ferredoxin subunit
MIGTDVGWVVACEAGEISPGEAVVVPGDLAVVFNVGGELFATEPSCTHAQWSLGDADIDDDIVTCPLHGAQYCIRSGAVVRGPAPRPLVTYPVHVSEGKVYVDIP